MPTFTTHPLTNLVFFLALLTSAWSCTSSRLSEKGKSDGKSAQKDESETSTSTSTSSGAASEVPPWTDMVDASQVGLAPTDAESSSSQPSTQVSGTNLTENSATIADPSTVCAALDVMGALAIPNKLACLASRTLRATLYADHLPASGAAAISCSTYVPGERNGILMDVSCRDIYRDRDQMTQAKDLKAGSDSLYDIFRFDRFDQTRPAVGSWTAAGPALGRYPAQMRYWTGADGAKRPVISLATDGGRYAKGYFDSEPLGGAVRGEYLKSLVDDGSGCRAKPGINNCVEQSAKVVLPGDAAQSMSFHTLSDRPSAPSFLLAEGRMMLSPDAAKEAFGRPDLPFELTAARQVYYRTVQANGQIWSSLDLKNEAGQPISDSDGTADRWRSAGGVCQQLGAKVEVPCTEIDPQAYAQSWQGPAAFEPPPFDYQIPLAAADAPDDTESTPCAGDCSGTQVPGGSTTTLKACEGAPISALTIGQPYACPETATCGGSAALPFYGALFKKTALTIDWFKGGGSNCVGTAEPYPIKALVLSRTGTVPNKGIWGERLDADSSVCQSESNYPSYTYRLPETLTAFDAGACLYQMK